MTTLTESDVEQATLVWLSGGGWQLLGEPDIAPVSLASLPDLQS